MFHWIAKLQAVVVEKPLWEFFVSSRNWEKRRAMDFYDNLGIAISISLVQVSGSRMIKNKISMSIVHIHHGQKQATFLQAASMVKEAMKGQMETLIITQLLWDVDYFLNIAYYVDKSHVTMLHLSRDLSKFASLANNFIAAKLIERDTSTRPRSKLVCTKVPPCFVKGGKDYLGNSAIYPFKIWDLGKCSSTRKKKEVTTIQVNVSPVDDTGAGLKKSCHRALVLGKTEQEIASQVGSDPAWIIPGHSTLAFDPLPSEDGASYARSEKKSKKAKKKETRKETKKAKKVKSSERDKAGTSQPPSGDTDMELKVTQCNVGSNEAVLCEERTVSAATGTALVDDPVEDLEVSWEPDMFDEITNVGEDLE